MPYFFRLKTNLHPAAESLHLFHHNIDAHLRITLRAACFEESKEIMDALFGVEWFPARHAVNGMQFALRLTKPALERL